LYSGKRSLIVNEFIPYKIEDAKVAKKEKQPFFYRFIFSIFTRRWGLNFHQEKQFGLEERDRKAGL
jgi:hypothetical protein